MSLFGLVGELDDDPFMGGHVRRMNNLMNNLFRDPFADMMFGGNSRSGMFGGSGMLGELMPFTGGRHPQSQAAVMLSGGFPPFFDQMGGAGNGHVASMSTVMTMSHGPDGRPQVYQASQTVRQGPGGIRETKKTVSDSRTGMKKMSIGRHVYDRAHIIEREQNVYSGEREENEELINLDEEEKDQFNREWESRARNMLPNRNQQAAIGYIDNSGSHRRRHNHHHHKGEKQILALPEPEEDAGLPKTPQRSVGRSSRRSTYGLTHHPHQSAASAIAASEQDDSDEEQPPTKKMKNINNQININKQPNSIHQEEIDLIDGSSSEEEEEDVEEEEILEDYEEGEEDSIEELDNDEKSLTDGKV